MIKNNNYLENDISIEEDSLLDIFHAGTPHEGSVPHSGRYPWGSGENSFQRPSDFKSFVNNRTNKGLSQVEVATGLGMSTTQLRAYLNIAYAITRAESVKRARELKEGTKDNGKPYTNTEIGVILGNEFQQGTPIGESQVRNLLKYDDDVKRNAAFNTAKFLMEQVDKKGMIDVGEMVNKELNISSTKMNDALTICEAEGYVILRGSVPQQTNVNQKTNLKVLAPKGTPKASVYDYSKINHVTDYTSNDKGYSFKESYHWPRSLNSNRVMIRSGEDGKAKDGLIEIRDGVKDLSLGSTRYAQVRILVDDNYYMKGMAVYSDGKDMPEGIDIIYNSNKEPGLEKYEYLKSTSKNLDKDPTNPFASTIKEVTGQSYYDDPTADPNSDFARINPITNRLETLSPVNKLAEAGDWKEWSKELPAQFLSKQPKVTISKQLNKSMINRQDEFEEIMEITNPTVKAKLLKDFADNCDTAAEDLKSVSFPGTRYHVILPGTTIGNNEVYAPNFPEGSQLALVRFPHGGIFEIPILTVTHHNKEAEEMIGPNSTDAIVISADTAKQLSGADFDGDTVLTIPTPSEGIKINAKNPLKELENFDTSDYAPDPDGYKKDTDGTEHWYRNGREFKHMSEIHKQHQMGIVSNLITDMTLKGASDDEIARAVKHSMVVIDAVKHNLDYKQSEYDNKISELKKTYQQHSNDSRYGGAGTLISRAKNEQATNKLAEGKYILSQPNNPDNGNELDLVDPFNNLYLDRKTNKIYSEKDKRTVTIDPKTGEKLYRQTGEVILRVRYKDENGDAIQVSGFIKDGTVYKKPKTMWQVENNQIYYRNENGDFVKTNQNTSVIANYAMEKRTRMSQTSDAQTLSSGTIQEEYYSNYANKLKSLANTARKEYLYQSQNPIPYDPAINKEYKEEVKSVQAKVAIAELNAPKERAAQLMAAAIVKERLDSTVDDLTSEDIRKLKQNEITKARNRFGAKNQRFGLTEKEWEAIMKGAFSPSYLANSILRYADSDIVKKLATPKETRELTNAEVNKIKGLSANGQSNASIAKYLGISINTVIKYLSGKEN